MVKVKEFGRTDFKNADDNIYQVEFTYDRYHKDEENETIESEEAKAYLVMIPGKKKIDFITVSIQETQDDWQEYADMYISDMSRANLAMMVERIISQVDDDDCDEEGLSKMRKLLLEGFCYLGYEFYDSYLAFMCDYLKTMIDGIIKETREVAC